MLNSGSYLDLDFSAFDLLLCIIIIRKCITKAQVYFHVILVIRRVPIFSFCSDSSHITLHVRVTSALEQHLLAKWVSFERRNADYFQALSKSYFLITKKICIPS